MCEIKNLLTVFSDEFVCCREGFDAKRVEAILHKIELSIKHQSEKFGLHLGIVSVDQLQWFFGSKLSLMLFLWHNAGMGKNFYPCSS